MLYPKVFFFYISLFFSFILFQGPGERCGGPRGILGECGEGLMCKDEERCGGCSSVTMECHQ